MLQREIIEKIKKSVYDWAKQYPHVELSLVEVYPSGIGDNVHVIVVAKKGFENWRKIERQNDIADFIGKQLGDAIVTKIPVLHAFTEEQYEKYEISREGVFV
jgi:acid stress-induced BolA-like protein IbaG/YrbA